MRYLLIICLLLVSNHCIRIRLVRNSQGKKVLYANAAGLLRS
jgi:hypothetical protein